jgi:hypothetical protein
MSAITMRTASALGHTLMSTGTKPAAVIDSCLKTLKAQAPATAAAIRSASLLSPEAVKGAYDLGVKHLVAAPAKVETTPAATNPKLDWFLESGKRLIGFKKLLDHMAENKLNLVKKDAEGNINIEFKGMHFTHSGVKADNTTTVHYFNPIKQSIAYYNLAKLSGYSDAALKAYLETPQATFDPAKFSDLCLNSVNHMGTSSDEDKVMKFVIYLARNISDKLDALRPSSVIDSKYFQLDRKGMELYQDFKAVQAKYS